MSLGSDVYLFAWECSFWIVKESVIVVSQHMMTMVLLILWRYMRILGTFFSTSKAYFLFQGINNCECQPNHVSYPFLFAEVLYISWPLTMIVELETLTWKSFKFAITSDLHGL
jgi:hypothetical protein